VTDPSAGPLGDDTATVSCTRLYLDASWVLWSDGWYAATIAGDAASRDTLMTVSNHIFPPNGVVAHIKAWREALQAFDADPGSVESLVARAVSYTADPTFATTWKVHRVHAAVYPLLIPIVRGDADAFNATLAEVLQIHKKFWGSRAEAQNYRGWVALGPLALCCLAADRGIPVRVESEYLLPYLINSARSPARG
jgi:hypothetical protein